MPVHPEGQQLIAALAEAGVPPFEDQTVPAARASALGFVALQGEPVEVGSVADRRVPGPAGEIPVRVYTPADGPAGQALPSVVYFHGGGFVIGDLEIVDNPCRRLAASTGAVVVSVDYRLAPEHRYPAAFEDCYAAAAWVVENAGQLRVDAAKVAVAGDSAGGNLAATVALAARDRGGPALAAQLFFYPVTDFNFNTESYQRNAQGYLLNKSSMQWFWAHYLGPQDLAKDPYACPLRADNLVGLPPAYVATCEYDPLRDEGEAYARRLEEAGVSVTAQRYDGQIHGYLWMLGAIPSAAVSLEDAVAVLRRAWGD